jgi:geranylgeranyl reductase
VPGAERRSIVFAYHEIVRTPAAPPGYDGSRCDVYYRGTLSPDFYGWVFPHGDTMSVGTGSADKGFSLRSAVGRAARPPAWPAPRRCAARARRSR